MKIEDILTQILKTKNSAFFYTPSFFKESTSYIFYKPLKVISINNFAELPAKIRTADRYIENGFTGYSLIKYEAGYFFEKKLLNLTDLNDKNLIQFYFFSGSSTEKINSNSIEIGAFKKDFKLSSFKLNASKQDFVRNIGRIKSYIVNGDTYQVNYTVKGYFDFSGDIIGLFKTLIFNQSAGYSAFINNDDEIIISISPELFFRYKSGKIISRPMKGTMKRGKDLESDNLQKQKLFLDKKNNSENLMIIDLLRNDIGKICEYGKVTAKNLFEVETYESLHQMVSTISGRLKPDIKFSGIIKSLFPCGSITGAPKIRTMEIIRELENEKRGIYTGSIGLINKNEFIYNVAIRTLVLNRYNRKGEIGLGSGIVWDSNPADEYDEILLKSNFLLKAYPYFELFETMLVEDKKIFLLKKHLERLRNSAQYFLFKYNENEVSKTIFKTLAKIPHSKKLRMRMFLSKWGKVKVQIDDYPENPREIIVIISQKKTDSNNTFLYHKTTNRGFYEKEHYTYYSKGFFDLLFFNKKNELTEGAVSNVFIRRRNMWYTPPVSCGLLPGIYRNYLLKSRKNAIEKIIHLDDILNADEILLTNSLRKELKVERLFLNDNEFRIF